MKNTILSLVFLLFGLVAFSQSEMEKTPAQEVTHQLADKYNLSEKQQAEILTIQERKYRNLEEIAELKKSNPALFIQKVRAMIYANDKAMQQLLDKDQLMSYLQSKAEFRTQKSTIYQEMKSAGSTQEQIDHKISKLEEEALLKG